jgi:hypothetical protein
MLIEAVTATERASERAPKEREEKEREEKEREN